MIHPLQIVRDLNAQNKSKPEHNHVRPALHRRQVYAGGLTSQPCKASSFPCCPRIITVLYKWAPEVAWARPQQTATCSIRQKRVQMSSHDGANPEDDDDHVTAVEASVAILLEAVGSDGDSPVEGSSTSWTSAPPLLATTPLARASGIYPLFLGINVGIIVKSCL